MHLGAVNCSFRIVLVSNNVVATTKESYEFRPTHLESLPSPPPPPFGTQATPDERDRIKEVLAKLVLEPAVDSPPPSLNTCSSAASFMSFATIMHDEDGWPMVVTEEMFNELDEANAPTPEPPQTPPTTRQKNDSAPEPASFMDDEDAAILAELVDTRPARPGHNMVSRIAGGLEDPRTPQAGGSRIAKESVKKKAQKKSGAKEPSATGTRPAHAHDLKTAKKNVHSRATSSRTGCCRCKGRG